MNKSSYEIRAGDYSSQMHASFDQEKVNSQSESEWRAVYCAK